MRNLDILAAENGEHIRVLLCGEEQCYVVSCQHFRMPYPVASDLLAELQPVPAETYSVFVLDEDVVWHVQVLGGEIPDGEDPVADEQIADALGLLCRDGDDADLDLVAAADLAEARQVHDGLAALGGADDSVVFIKRRDDIEAVLRKAGIPQQRAAKLAVSYTHLTLPTIA